MRAPILLSVPIVFLLCSSAAAAKIACIAPDQALQHLHKHACVEAHVYRIVDGSDGIRFLDVCSPETSDADCHFFIISSTEDKKSVGNLDDLVGQTIQIRGKILPIQGRADMIFSAKEQLHGGKPKFHPNPKLVKSFSAENGGQGFSPHNGVGGQHGVHFRHRGN
ncbi:MAG TPA: hypothetical protein VE195_04750 [Acidobacteriaceae bacterium]|nr:hypothetical protein [Acidobacteriaceae bacterium]